MGPSERRWDALWLTLFAAVLVGALNRLLPSVPAVQLVVVPAWLGYWMATRGPRLGAWVALWGGALLECDWDLPPGTCILFLLMIWGAIRLFRDNFPEEIGTLHGLLWGVTLAPVFRLWVWAWSACWPGVAAEALAPSLAGLLATPCAGALGGAAAFALARRAEFRVLKPKQEETLGHAN